MKQLFFLTTFLLAGHILIAQTPTRADVTTPKGSNVVAYIPNEMSSSNRAYWDSHYSSAYPNATQITTYGSYSSTNRFNCHGYAWYIEESGSGLNDPRWIGYYYTTAEDIYMTDGSYIQVVNEMYPGKVSWGSGDHSAITTSTAGVYKSKWNKYPLMQHDWDDTPYGTSNLKYYVSTKIDGSFEVMCNNTTRSFSVVNITGASYSWSVGGGLTLNSNGSYSTSITANYVPFYGSSWIEVTITSPIGGGSNDVKTSKRENIWVGHPEHVTGTLSGPSTVYTTNLYIYSVTDQNHYSGTFDWRTPRGFTHYAGGDGYNYVQVGINENAWDGYVQVWRTNACGNGGARFMYVTVEEGGGGPIETIVSPNPAIGEISVDFSNPEQFQDYITSLDVNNRSMNIEIISIYGEKVFSGNIGKGGLKLNLKNVKRGLYVVKVYNYELSSEVKLLLE